MILTTYETLGITGIGGLFGALIMSMIDHFFVKGRELKNRQWEIKRNSCLDALDVVDSMFANKYQHSGYQKLAEVKKIREVHNRLMLSCEDQKSIETFEKCIGMKGDYEKEDIVPLRDMLRKELGFKPIPMDAATAWIFINNLKDRDGKSHGSVLKSNLPN